MKFFIFHNLPLYLFIRVSDIMIKTLYLPKLQTVEDCVYCIRRISSSLTATLIICSVAYMVQWRITCQPDKTQCILVDTVNT